MGGTRHRDVACAGCVCPHWGRHWAGGLVMRAVVAYRPAQRPAALVLQQDVLFGKPIQTNNARKQASLGRLRRSGWPPLHLAPSSASPRLYTHTTASGRSQVCPWELHVCCACVCVFICVFLLVVVCLPARPCPPACSSSALPPQPCCHLVSAARCVHQVRGRQSARPTGHHEQGFRQQDGPLFLWTSVLTVFATAIDQVTRPLMKHDPRWVLPQPFHSRCQSSF